jgi:hypothetical protein
MGVEMAKRVGMQSLKRRLVPAMERAAASIVQDLTSESGTYPVSSAQAGAPVAQRDAGEVTLVVYGWHNVQPGTLSWVFPSFDAAMKAASALRNATQWAIMGGADASGAVLAERSA